MIIIILVLFGIGLATISNDALDFTILNVFHFRWKLQFIRNDVYLFQHYTSLGRVVLKYVNECKLSWNCIAVLMLWDHYSLEIVIIVDLSWKF